jgi:phosphohistidine phosphatase SixA
LLLRLLQSRAGAAFLERIMLRPAAGPFINCCLPACLPLRPAQVAEQLRAAGWLPQVVVCSNAQRTRQTLDQMQKAVPELADSDAHFLGSLYTTAALDGQTRGHLAEIVAAEAAQAHTCCLCLGHNKGWEEAASSFAVSAAPNLFQCCASLLWIQMGACSCRPASSFARSALPASSTNACKLHPSQLCPVWCWLRLLSLQGETVRLGNSHAALLEGAGASWEEALQEGSTWRLVKVLQP